MPYLAGLAVVALTTGLGFVLHRLMPHANLSLLYLAAVLVVATRSGMGPSLLASLVSFFAYNYFFTRPYYTLQVADKGDFATLAFFLVIASLTGNLAARMHAEIAKRHASLRQMSELFEFSRLLSSTVDTVAIADELAGYLQHALGCPARVLVAGASGLPEYRAETGEAPELPGDAIDWAWAQEAHEACRQGPWTFFPLAGEKGKVGLAAVHGPLRDEQVNTAVSLCEQAGVALDRTRLVHDLEEARLLTETEQLRSALLSSVSHDLRTPLAAIIGAASSLLEFGGSLKPGDQRELLGMVMEESQRLDRYIQNLLDMTRIGHGSLRLRRDWVDLRDLVSSALQRLRDSIKDVRIDLSLPEGLPLLWVHGVLIEQALVNVLDNAIRFSPPAGRVGVEARVVDGLIEVDVVDEGPGIPEHEKEQIFDMFYSAREGDRGRRQGTGLGLSICRGMVGAHGGTVEALPGPGHHGTRMRIRLPVAQPGGEQGR